MAGEAPNVTATIEQVEGWLIGAKAGDSFAYATRMRVAPRAATVAFVRGLAVQGLVNLAQRRIDAETRTYIAQRTSAPLRVGARAEAGRGAAADLATRVLAVLRRRAALGRPCPTDQELACCVARPVAEVPALLDRLVTAGAIIIEGKRERRVITIAATGDWTERQG